MVSKEEKEEKGQRRRGRRRRTEGEEGQGEERCLNPQAPVLVTYLKIIQQHEDWGEEGVEMLTHVRVLDSKNKSIHRFSKNLFLNQA